MDIMIQVSVLVMAIFVVQKIFGQRLHAYVRYGLWMLVALRLLIPVNLVESPFSAVRVMDAVGVQLGGMIQENGEADSQTMHSGNLSQGNDGLASRDGRTFAQWRKHVSDHKEADGEGLGGYEGQQAGEWQAAGSGEAPEDGQSDSSSARAPLQSTDSDLKQYGNLYRKIFLVIWVVGAVLVGGYLAAVQYCFWRMLYRKRRAADWAAVLVRESQVPVYHVPGLASPCLVGLLNPSVYIGTEIMQSPDSLRYALMHEQVHYFHKDHMWALLRAVLVTLYWFHPFVWIAAAASARDGEIACDYGTVCRLGEAERFSYGEMLLQLSKKNTGERLYSYGTMLRTGRSEIRERIVRLTAPGGVRVSAGIFTVFLMIIVAGCAFTGASDIPESAGEGNLSEDPEKKDESETAGGDLESDTANGQEETITETREIEAEPAQISIETPLGVDGPVLDYAAGQDMTGGNSRMIFHDYFGLVVYDVTNSQVVGSLDLESIGCHMTQGDDTCQVAVSADGQTVWLHPMSKRYMYRYEVDKNLLYQEPLVKSFRADLESRELFDRYLVTEEEYIGWRSNYLYEEYTDETGGHEAYIYLYASSSEVPALRNLQCVWDDMVFVLFQNGINIPAEPDRQDEETQTVEFPYSYDGNVENVQIHYDVPCVYDRISDPYGGRVHPLTGEIRLHEGIDYAAAAGTDVVAAADGIVYETGSSPEYGNYVVLLHINGDMTYYCTCQKVTVTAGDQVKRGDKIATVGSTGMSTGSHLHFALSRKGCFVDPEENMRAAIELERDRSD